MADLDPPVHDELHALFPEAVAEFHVLQNGEELLREPAGPSKEAGLHGKRVGRDVVRRYPLGLRIMDEDGLKDAEKAAVERERRVGPPDDRGPGPGERAVHPAERILPEDAVGINEEQVVSHALACARVPGCRSAGMGLQPHQPAGIPADDVRGIVRGAIIDHDHLEARVP